MQGIPGSGKSTMAAKIKAQFLAEIPTGFAWDSEIFSTDHFWTEEDGMYRFNPEMAGEAHSWNQRRVVEAMRTGMNQIIIDNTNIQKWEAAPYFALAKMFGYDVQVVTVSVSLDEALRRNARRSFDRRIPEDVVRKKHADLEPLL